jgi:hypothetical protein
MKLQITESQAIILTEMVTEKLKTTNRALNQNIEINEKRKADGYAKENRMSELELKSYVKQTEQSIERLTKKALELETILQALN